MHRPGAAHAFKHGVGPADGRFMEEASAGRVLFVDDEPLVLEGIENLLFDAPEEWELEFANGGRAALEHLESDSYDVIVTDMRMPGMDGAELLGQVRARFPSLVRIVLSGHTEEEAAQRAMPMAHEFLSKPCDVQTLVGALNRALQLATRFTSKSLRDALGTIEALPARPATYLKVKSMMDNDDDVDDVAAVIEQEFTIAAKVLHVANTAFYSRGRTTSNVREAVVTLGLSTTAGLVLAAEAYSGVSAPRWLNVDALHEHAHEVGKLASLLVTKEHRDEALLGGLMHDMGSLLVAMHFPEQARAAQGGSEGHWEAIIQREVSGLGFSHADIGAHLLRLWQIGEEAAKAVEFHHRTGVQDRHEVELSVFAADYALHHGEPVECEACFTPEENERVAAARALRLEIE